MSFLLLLMWGGGPADLVERLGSHDLDERDTAAAQLEALGAGAFADLEKGLSHSDAEVRARAHSILVRSWKDLPSELIDRQPALRAERVSRVVAEFLEKTSVGFGWSARSRDDLLKNEQARKLESLGREAVPALMMRLSESPIRITAALGLWDDPAAARLLDELSESTQVYELPGR